jgi:Fic-DOC domain mobile mystery protein B
MSDKGSSWASEGPAGSTPLDSSDLDGLKLSWVATQDDLNGAEQANIVRALGQRKWTSMPVNRVLDDLTLRQLHRAMFSEVWRWAGRYRTTERNIGIAPEHVAVAVRDLTADTLMWVSGTNPRPFDEVGVLFHHRLVAIHPFPNGNGRHARAATDLLLRSLDQAAFTWGSTSLNEASDTRARYISALQRADGGDLGALLEFVRT